MKLDQRLTNGLAWAGALLVVGVPAADYLARQFWDEPSPRVSVVEAQPNISEPVPDVAEAPVAETPPPTPEAAPAEAPANTGSIAALPRVSGDDAVDGFLQSGRDLPSYITDAASPRPAIAAPAPVSETPPTQTAAIPDPVPTITSPAPVASAPAPSVSPPTTPVRVAPVPMPLSMRPPAPVAPLIVEEPVIRPPVVTQPPSAAQPPSVVTAEDLQNWESGPLSDFLRQRGQASFDPYAGQGDGFYIEERQPRRERESFPFAYEGEEFYQPF